MRHSPRWHPFGASGPWHRPARNPCGLRPAVIPALRGSAADAIPDKFKDSIRKIYVKTVTLGKDDGESEKVDVNNDSLVLREVLKQLGEIREQQRAMNNGQKSIQMDPAEPKGNGKANGEANGVANGEANGEVGLKI